VLYTFCNKYDVDDVGYIEDGVDDILDVGLILEVEGKIF
jgi:hypothetical protein